MLARCSTSLVFFSAASALALGCSGCRSTQQPADPQAIAQRDELRREQSSSELELEFSRASGSTAFDVLIAMHAADGGPIRSHGVRVSVRPGSAGPVAEEGGRFRARITPDGSGRHKVTVSVPELGLEASRVALVLDRVHEDWDQPVPVPGLVNTLGWEDGPAVSPDGQWLIVQYLPVPIDCVLGLDPKKEVCRKVIGPIAAPERPRMPGASRVAKDGTITHGCPSLGVPSLPFPVPPNALYGFRRQPDGSFAEPFVIHYDGSDGCVSAFGPALTEMDGSRATLVYAFDTPLDNGEKDSVGDLFAARVELGKDIVLGKFSLTPSGAEESASLGVPIGHPREGHEGNPHPYFDGKRTWVLYDDEQKRKELFAVSSDAGLLGGSWSKSVMIQPPVSASDAEESQPFFDGKHLYFRRGLTLFRSAYRGGPLGGASAFAEPETVLSGNEKTTKPGEILGAGEPTVAVLNGYQELYFVYVERAPDGTLNLDVGRVRSR